MTKKKATAPAADKIEDVAHETVSNGNGLPAVKAEPMTEEQVIHAEIQKFNVSDAAIANLHKQYGGLAITGPDDKTGYKAVKDAWGEVRSLRTGLQKTGKDLRARFNAITKGIIKEEDRLEAQITTLETALYEKWKKIDDDKELEKKRKEQEETDRLLKRVEQLLEAGMLQQEGFYTIGGTIAVDVATLRAMDEGKFGKLLQAVQSKKTELDEAARLEAERKVKEEEKLKADQAELARQQAEVQRLQEEAKQALRQGRGQMLTALGLGYVGGAYRMWSDDKQIEIIVWPDEMDLPADQWRQHFEKVSEHVAASLEANAKYKADKEKAEKEQAEKEQRISEIMTAVGISYAHTLKSYYWHNDFFHLEAMPVNELLKQDLEMLERLAIGWGEKITEAKQKQEEARQAAQTDEVNMSEYLTKLMAVDRPDIKSLPAKADLAELFKVIYEMQTKYEQK